MAHVRKVETSARRGGKPVSHYEVRWTETYLDADGTRRKRYPQETYRTRAEADARVSEIESERAATGAVTGREARLEPFSSYTVAWLNSLDIRVQRGTLKERTRDEYARIITTYLLPEFGGTPIGAVSPERVEQFAATLLSGRSPATFDRIWHVFGRVLKYAVRKGAIPTSPCEHTEVDDGRDSDDTFTPHPLTAHQVAAVAAHIGQRYPVYALVTLFLAYSGLRAAELAGLEVGDLTLTPPPASTPGGQWRGTVRVARTKRRVGGQWKVGTPKSRKSRRTVPLDGWLAEMLADYLIGHPGADDPAAPLFPNRRKGGAPGARVLNWSSPVEPGALYDGVFKPALAACGLPVSTRATPGVRLHDLRHTFAVLSLSAGEHYMMVSKWLGHANFTITLNVYGDYIPEDEGGKAAPLARPTAPAPIPTPAAPTSNVLPFRRRSTG